jgi:hypothetical protein
MLRVVIIDGAAVLIDDVVDVESIEKYPASP